jgi:hypothetical protein
MLARWQHPLTAQVIRQEHLDSEQRTLEKFHMAMVSLLRLAQREQ